MGDITTEEKDASETTSRASGAQRQKDCMSLFNGILIHDHDPSWD